MTRDQLEVRAAVCFALAIAAGLAALHYGNPFFMVAGGLLCRAGATWAVDAAVVACRPRPPSAGSPAERPFGYDADDRPAP